MNLSACPRFTVAFPSSQLEDLHRRLAGVRWPEMPFDAGWNAGTRDDVLRELVAYWRSGFDWAGIQSELNRLEHHTTTIEGERLHFVVHRAEAGGGKPPLLLLHGWPGSFAEFNAAARLLTARGFDLIVPSLPGFVFSDAPRVPGMTPSRVAERLHVLMEKLGCERYGVQGGDWGSPVAREMARLFPNAVAALHINLAPWLPPLEGRVLTPAEESYLAARKAFDAGETGYWSLHGTKPQTLAYAQHDSPVGLLAWMLEKFWAWSDHGTDLWQTFRRDDLLTHVTLYWLTGRILSAARIYHEAWAWWPGDLSRVSVPTGYARFPKEPWGPPASLVLPFFNLVHSTEMPRGGHFAAQEQPELFADDVASFFSRHC